MSVTLNGRSDLVHPAARVIRTAIDTGDGGTPEQRRLFQLLATSVWLRNDLDLDSLPIISPIEVAQLFDDEVAAWRLRQMLVLFEVMRHPQTDEQVLLVDGFALALGGDDEGLRLVRGVVRDETTQALEHFRQAWDRGRDRLSEPAVLARFEGIDDAIDDPDLARRLRAMRDLSRGTLGREYIEFYLENRFKIPGEGVAHPAFFLQHDMSHLVAGLGPSAPGEIALTAFQLGMEDNEAHWMQFVAGLAAYELGVFGAADFVSKEGVLEREGTIELMVESFLRGTRCTSNYNAVSLLDLADRPIAELRQRFGVLPPRDPFPEVIDVDL
ncbi:MAG: hypothetical protein FGM58_01860 [Acidimicrobiia bacterium]|nr:hypothetical protein [Acidimicrobiia bacterium]